MLQISSAGKLLRRERYDQQAAASGATVDIVRHPVDKSPLHRLALLSIQKALVSDERDTSARANTARKTRLENQP